MTIKFFIKIILIFFGIPVSIIILGFYFVGMDRMYHRDVTIYNNSTDTIYIFYSFENYLPFKYIYYEPYRGAKKELSGDVHMIEPDSLYVEHIISRERLDKNDSIPFFFITQDSVNQYSWDIIQAREIYTKRYKYSIKDLDSLKWNISYP